VTSTKTGKNEREARSCGGHRTKKSGGKEPAQPSIPEGILGFLSPDADLRCTRQTKIKLMKHNDLFFGVAVKKKCRQ
jgi:hypothetical protein